MIRIKICGITNLEDALAAERLGADVLGFIFTQKSPRYINPDSAKKIISSLGPFVLKAGVFMNQKKSYVRKVALRLGLDVLQFHGRESPNYCNFFQPRFKVVKVFFPDFSSKLIDGYRQLGALMFDLPYKRKEEGDKNLPADFLKLIKEKISEKRKVIISGGLNTKNLKKITSMNPYGIDVASGVEISIGKKNIVLLEDFIKKVKNAGS